MTSITTADLHRRGLNKHQIAQLVKSGQLVRLSRGIYLSCPDGRPADRRLLHEALASSRDDVLALESAALLHRLPTLFVPELVTTVRPGGGRSRTSRTQAVLTGPLPAQHVTLVGDQLATSIARTVVDLTRVRGLAAGLVPWEAARWNARVEFKLPDFDAQVAEAIDTLKGRHGIDRARQALSMASALSQSPAETRSRLAMMDVGLPMPVQQFEVLDERGNVVATTDFAWPELGVLGEYDGQDKYTVLARPGETPAQVVRREKRRQEAAESLGWVFARWGKEEVARPALLLTRVRRAFGIAERRGHLSLA
ncbi:type IV toxin-antitoxin system AbiEi family antitoxin domain-containing protein [Propionibacteriaceae bacterium G1746]|uniref:type IV toxin-antitoxin system AbiEi family antitoxin domain-containing protein n=1 Tax=Aestuariimicrobium sp. G57 TaxID=3418485 RepID=UPI003C285C91